MPQLFNAAVAFPLFFEEDELQRHVLSLRPTHAVLKFGPEVATNSGPFVVSPDRLEAGQNTILIEAGQSFFLSLTDKRDWPLPQPLPAG